MDSIVHRVMGVQHRAPTGVDLPRIPCELIEPGGGGASWVVLGVVVKGEKQDEEEPGGREGERLRLEPCALEEVGTLRPASGCLS